MTGYAALSGLVYGTTALVVHINVLYNANWGIIILR